MDERIKKMRSEIETLKATSSPSKEMKQEEDRGVENWENYAKKGNSKKKAQHSDEKAEVKRVMARPMLFGLKDE